MVGPGFRCRRWCRPKSIDLIDWPGRYARTRSNVRRLAATILRVADHLGHTDYLYVTHRQLAGWSGLGRGLVGQLLPHVMSQRVGLFRWGSKGKGSTARRRGEPSLVWLKKSV